MAEYTIVRCGQDALTPSAKAKVAFFDLDHTLITPKGKTKFPKSVEDWKWKNDAIVPKLRALHDDAFDIVIITNQKKLQPDEVRTKANLIHDDLKVPFILFAGHADEYYRKPHTGLWKEVIVKQFLQGKRSLLDSRKCFFCGDMESDAYFAKNAGLKFVHTDTYFLGETQGVPQFAKEHPIQDDISHEKGVLPEATLLKPKTLVVMVGAPASGKSTIARYLETQHNYARINKDEMKTDAKMKKHFGDALKAGKSIVIDNTNPTPETRKKWIDEARKNDYHAIIIWMDLPKRAVEYLNHFRAEQAKTGSVMIPAVAFRVYYSKFVKPLKAECDHLITIDKVPCAYQTEDVCRLMAHFWA